MYKKHDMKTQVIPNISVDCVIFGFDGIELNVLLKERKLKDEKGNYIINDHTLTGHHVLKGETAEQAAQRILKEVTGFDNIFLNQFHTFSETDRLSNPKDQIWIKYLKQNYGLDIADHVFTIAFYALVDTKKFTPDSEHQNVAWYPVKNIPELGFDHKRIMEKALESLRYHAKHEPIVFELLPEKFTLTELQTAIEAIFDVKLDKRNFRRKIQQVKYIIQLDEKQKGVAHKPANLFIFSWDVYERTKKEKLILPF